ncbi:TonB-dependent receptor [Undibacterium sp. TJN25]|uniref:TonB-dependent receptor n=1 Tax=Undibacterium sp. TJN25 TaxID=3413056 RepID=UPI003BEF68AF
MKMNKRKLVLAISQALLGTGISGISGMTAGTALADDDVATVVVTAQSRSQSAQAVPIAMQIVGADQISKLAATNLSSMNGYIPGLNVDGNQPTQPYYTLRGIGTSDFGIGTDSPVGVYVDGVYSGKTGGALMSFNDVQRIEVLKGPQGTLFGRNSAAGAISIITREPTQAFEADLHARLGNYSSKYFDGVINVPLGDKAALRFSAVGSKSDGWITDAATGQKYKGDNDWGTRATLLLNAPAQTKLLLSWEHEYLNDRARPAISLVHPAAPGTLPTVPSDPSTYVDPRNGPLYNDGVGNREAKKFDGVTFRIEKPLGWATFNSTTAYRHFNSVNREDEDGTNRIETYLDTANIESNTTWQQEFKLSGKNDTVDWLVGASYFSERARQNSQINTYTDSLNTLFNNVAGLPVYSVLNGAAQQFGLPVNLFGNSWQENMFNRGDNKSYAVYGDAIWHLAPKMNLTTGIRFSRDSKEFSWYAPNRISPGVDGSLALFNQVGFFPGLVQAGAISAEQAGLIQSLMSSNQLIANAGASLSPYSTKRSWNDTSPRVLLDYHLTPDVMFYGSVSKGYQSGGYNTLQVGSKYDPEQVWNYEAGVKSNLRDYHLVLNASVFSYKFSNLQSLSLVAGGNSVGVPAYQVVSSDQKANGFDVEARWQPLPALRLYLTTEYIDQKYKDYVANDGTNLSGQPVGTPKWTAATGFDYTWHNVAGGHLNLTLQHAYTGATRCNDDSVAQGACLSTPRFTVGSAMQRTDARIGWTNDSQSWGVSLFANNLFDKRYVYNVSNITASFGTPFASITAPRMVGVEFRASM